jgi:hypothetical protein
VNAAKSRKSQTLEKIASQSSCSNAQHTTVFAQKLQSLKERKKEKKKKKKKKKKKLSNAKRFLLGLFVALFWSYRRKVRSKTFSCQRRASAKHFFQVCPSVLDDGILANVGLVQNVASKKTKGFFFREKKKKKKKSLNTT